MNVKDDVGCVSNSDQLRTALDHLEKAEVWLSYASRATLGSIPRGVLSEASQAVREIKEGVVFGLSQYKTKTLDKKKKEIARKSLKVHRGIKRKKVG